MSHVLSFDAFLHFSQIKIIAFFSNLFFFGFNVFFGFNNFFKLFSVSYFSTRNYIFFKEVYWGQPGIEPGTSRSLCEIHTARPLSHLFCVDAFLHFFANQDHFVFLTFFSCFDEFFVILFFFYFLLFFCKKKKFVFNFILGTTGN